MLRFRTAKDAELALKRAVDKGEKLPDTDRFDSNCITPGTVFMDRLHKQLQYFIKHKISTDSTWQKPKIILSGHNVSFYIYFIQEYLFEKVCGFYFSVLPQL